MQSFLLHDFPQTGTIRYGNKVFPFKTYREAKKPP